MDKLSLANKIIEKIHQSGHQAVLAGGCVRDRLRGVEPKDFDIATSAYPEAIQKIFEKTVPVGVQFGVIIVIEEGLPFEVATFRREGSYQDGRHPDQVSFAKLEEDAQRRDFTVNGLYFDTKKNQIIDLVQGEADLQKKVIRTIGEPQKRFQEDHLRLLRAVRFAAQLEFEIEPATYATVKKLAPLIETVSHERIRDELNKILTSVNPARGIRLLDDSGLLHFILPEIEKMKGVEQPCEFHPEGDVFVHTMMLLEGLKNAPIELAMGCLLHDVAKPQTFVRAADRIRFHGHDTLGAKMAQEICRKLCYSNEQIELIDALVLHHLRFKDAFNMRVSTLKRFLSLPFFELHLELHRLDCMASHKNLDAYEFCKKKYEEFKTLSPPPLKLIGGKELIELGHTPGPAFKEIITKVEDQILEGHIQTKEQAIQFVKKNFRAY